MTELEQLVCTRTQNAYYSQTQQNHASDWPRKLESHHHPLLPLQRAHRNVAATCPYTSKAHYDHRAPLVLSLHPDIIHTRSYASTVDMTAGVLFLHFPCKIWLETVQTNNKKHEFWVYKSYDIMKFEYLNNIYNKVYIIQIYGSITEQKYICKPIISLFTYCISPYVYNDIII